MTTPGTDKTAQNVWVTFLAYPGGEFLYMLRVSGLFFRLVSFMTMTRYSSPKDTGDAGNGRKFWPASWYLQLEKSIYGLLKCVTGFQAAEELD